MKLVFGSEEANEQLARDTGRRFDLRDADPFGRQPIDESEIEEEPEHYCRKCGSYMEWVDCWQCGGKGGRDGDDLMAEDPLWYDEDDWEDCDIWEGKGGWLECSNLPHKEEASA